MKILVLGGTHGNERLGVDLVRSLETSPISGVEACIANPDAVQKNVRFIETDLNRSFGVQKNASYEVVRAKDLTGLTKNYDVVLDFHNTQTPHNNCAFVGVDATPMLYNVAKTLGYQQIIQATYDCINKYCLNTISMEISIGDKWDDVGIWRRKITELRDVKLASEPQIDIYRFLRRVTWGEARTLKGSNSWQPFVEIPDEDKKSLNLEGVVVPIFIGSRLTEYYATLLVYLPTR